MGLIRKALAIQTLGLVSPNSKKQRAANRTNRLLEKQNRILAGGGSRRAKKGPTLATAAVPITRRYRVACHGCGEESLAPAGSVRCPHCGVNMNVTPNAP